MKRLRGVLRRLPTLFDRGAFDAACHEIRRVVPIGDGRYALELPLDPPPERLLTDLAASGAKLISLNPIRPTLEDLFVEQVTSIARGDPSCRDVVRLRGRGTT